MTDYIERKELIVFLGELRELIDTTMQRLNSVAPTVTKVDTTEDLSPNKDCDFVARLENEPLANHPNDPIFNLNKKRNQPVEISPGVVTNRILSESQLKAEKKLVPLIQKIKDNPLLLLADNPLTT